MIKSTYLAYCRIINISVKFILNEMSQVYLEDVMKLETKALIKF